MVTKTVLRVKKESVVGPAPATAQKNASAPAAAPAAVAASPTATSVSPEAMDKINELNALDHKHRMHALDTAASTSNKHTLSPNNDTSDDDNNETLFPKSIIHDGFKLNRRNKPIPLAKTCIYRCAFFRKPVLCGAIATVDTLGNVLYETGRDNKGRRKDRHTEECLLKMKNRGSEEVVLPSATVKASNTEDEDNQKTTRKRTKSAIELEGELGATLCKDTQKQTKKKQVVARDARPSIDDLLRDAKYQRNANNPCAHFIQKILHDNNKETTTQEAKTKGKQTVSQKRAKKKRKQVAAEDDRPTNDDDLHQDVTIEHERFTNTLHDDQTTSTRPANNTKGVPSQLSPQLSIPTSFTHASGAASNCQGVSFAKSDDKWYSQIMINGRSYYRQYENEEEAAIDYALAAYRFEVRTAAHIPSMSPSSPIVQSNDVEYESLKYHSAPISYDAAISELRTLEVMLGRDLDLDLGIGSHHHSNERAMIQHAHANYKYQGGGEGQWSGSSGSAINDTVRSNAAWFGGLSHSQHVMETQPLTPQLTRENSLGERTRSNDSMRNASIDSHGSYGEQQQQQQQQQAMAPIQSVKSLSKSDTATLYKYKLEPIFCKHKPTLESLLSSVCESVNFDFVEVWLHDNKGSYHLAHSFVSAKLNESLFDSISGVYRNYVQGSAERTHRLSCALCKWAKKTGIILRVSKQKHPRLAEALEHSISGVKMAMAVPVFQDGVSATIALFSMSGSEQLTKDVEEYQDNYLRFSSHKIMTEMGIGQVSR